MTRNAYRRVSVILGFALAGAVACASAQESATPQQSSEDQSSNVSDLLSTITQGTATTDTDTTATGASDQASMATPAAEPATQESQSPQILDVIPVPMKKKELVEEKSKVPPPRVEEIVVTATKRTESLRNIPATINVLTGKDLERQGVQGIEQIVAQVPGVNLSDDGTGQAKRVTIRGISTDVNVNFTAGTLFGDIPFSDPFIPKVQLDPNPFDMATVEVLKGPQGTLFGGSGLNGMIRYVPQAPELDQFRVKYFTQLTSYPGNGDSGWSYGAVVNAPFANNTAAVRVMGFHRDAPGFIDDTQSGKADVNSAKQYGVRAMAAWQPNEDWKFSLMGTTQHTKQADASFADNGNGNLQRGNTPRPSPVESSYTLGNLGIERAFSWADLVSQTAYFRKSYDLFADASRVLPGGMIPLLSAVDTNRSKGMSQELRLVSADSDSPWKWLVGGFYFNMHLNDCAEAGLASGLPSLPVAQVQGVLNSLGLSALPLPSADGVIATPCSGNVSKIGDELDIAQLHGDIKVQENALFGEVTRKLGDEWEVTLGARAYRTKSGGTVSNSGILYSAQNLGQPGQRDATIAEHGLSPKASISYQPTDDVRTYFTMSRGFRFGGPQLGASTPTTQVPTFFKSDTLWNYELGLRTDWFDQQLRIDAAVYKIVWTNPQVFQQSNDSLATFIDNVGGVKGLGSEVSIRYLPEFVQGLSLNTSASWNRTETTTPFKSASGVTVPTGSSWPLAPRWQTSTTLAYTLPLETWQAGVSLRHSYSSKACNTIECTGKVFGFRTMDLNVFASPVGDSYWPQVSLSLDNLTDERGISNVSTSTTLGTTWGYIAPRTLVLRLGGNF